MPLLFAEDITIILLLPFSLYYAHTPPPDPLSRHHRSIIIAHFFRLPRRPRYYLLTPFNIIIIIIIRTPRSLLLPATPLLFYVFTFLSHGFAWWCRHPPTVATAYYYYHHYRRRLNICRPAMPLLRDVIICHGHEKEPYYCFSATAERRSIASPAIVYIYAWTGLIAALWYIMSAASYEPRY